VGDIAVVLFVLRDSPQVMTPGAHPGATATRSWWRAASYGALAILVCATTSVAWWMSRPAADRPRVTRFSLTVGDDERLLLTAAPVVSISPDGTKVAYQTTRGVHVRSMEEGTDRLVETRGVNLVFSPDSGWLAFYAPTDRALQKISLRGGAPITLCDAATPAGISWGSTGIVFGQGRRIVRVPADGGAPEELVTVEAGELARAPQLLPDGDSLLFTIASADQGPADEARIVVQSLKSGQRKTLVENGSDGRYLASGHLVYALGGALFARAFNLQDLRVTGGAVPVVDGMRRGSARPLPDRALETAQFSVSQTGSLVYVPGPSVPSANQLQLVLDDGQGKITPFKIPPQPYQYPRSSPDGRYVVFTTDDRKEENIWIYELEGTSSPRRITFGGKNRYPVWSGDGRWIAFQSDREGDAALFRLLADGSSAQPERLTKADPGTSHTPESWSLDGQYVLFTITTGNDVALQLLSMTDRRVTPFSGVHSSVFTNAVFSPDGLWVAYSAREPNRTRNTLYVEPFPPTGAKHQIATNDAHMPVWSRDGRTLFFIHPDMRSRTGNVAFVQTPVYTRPAFSAGQPVLVDRDFAITGPAIGRSRTFDVLPDGRFIGVRDELLGGREPDRVEVVLNWFEELKARVPPN
jgi:Tol biopolymer transport system component